MKKALDLRRYHKSSNQILESSKKMHEDVNSTKAVVNGITVQQDDPKTAYKGKDNNIDNSIKFTLSETGNLLNNLITRVDVLEATFKLLKKIEKHVGKIESQLNSERAKLQYTCERCKRIEDDIDHLSDRIKDYCRSPIN